MSLLLPPLLFISLIIWGDLQQAQGGTSSTKGYEIAFSKYQPKIDIDNEIGPLKTQGQRRQPLLADPARIIKPYGFFKEPTNRLVTHSSPPTIHFSSRESFKVLVWNIYKKSHPKFLKTFEDQINTSDVALIQESLLNSRLLNFYENSDFSWWTGVSFFLKRTHGLIGTGVSFGSRWVIGNIKTLTSKVKEPLIGTPKMALFVDLPLVGSNKVIKFINVHLINFVGLSKFVQHIQQISKEMENHKGPLVLAGDFNDWSKSRKRELNQLIEEHDLQKVVFDQDPRSKQVDHIFIRGLEVLNAQVFHEIKFSDHKPLMAELRLLPP